MFLIFFWSKYQHPSLLLKDGILGDKFCLRETLNLSTDADRRTNIIIIIIFSQRGSFFEVPLKCHWSANSHQPTAIATDLPLLAPQLSTVGWSKTMHLTISEKQTTLNFYSFIPGQILGIHSLNSGLHNILKWMFCDVTDIQTYRQTLQLYDWIGRFSEKAL